MTDELNEEQEQAVRRLLADARHDAPMPPEVAARMDQVISGLAAERGAPPGAVPLPPPHTQMYPAQQPPQAPPGSVGPPFPPPSGPAPSDNVVPFRRRLPQLLVAAAVVGLVGFGVTQVITDDNDRDAAGGSFSFESDRGPGSPSELPESGDSDEGAGPGDEEPPMSAAPTGPPEEPPVLTDLDAASLARLHDGLEQDDREVSGELSRLDCGPFDLPSGAEVGLARHRGGLVVVVFTEQGDQTLAQVYDCAGPDPGTPTESVVLPGRE